MGSFWHGWLPWLALAGAGALHGLNPASGWIFAGASRHALRALVPLALGHLGSVLLVAGAVALGMAADFMPLQLAAGGLLLVAMLWRCRWSAAVSLGLWSFIVATASGAGLMLVPALAPLCISGSPAREITASGSLGLALAAVLVHLLAMLLSAGVMATGVSAVLARRLPRRRHEPQLPPSSSDRACSRLADPRRPSPPRG